MRVILAGVLVASALALWLSARSGATVQQNDDYFLLAMTWTPAWCAATGAARGDARCDRGAGAGWLVHGLWPQHAGGGWPEYCDTAATAPGPAILAGMDDIMGSTSLARHQWRKHGTCSGLTAQAYFAQTRAAFEALDFPDAIRARTDARHLSPEEVLAAFRAANPTIGAAQAIVTCRQGRIEELRLCLTRNLAPRDCDAGVLARHCTAARATLPAKP